MSEEKIIDAVRPRVFLYDKQHPKYRDTKLKKNAWRQIAEEVELPVSLCKMRWQNIRGAYRKFLNRTNATQSGRAADGRTKNNYKFGSALAFLNEHLEERRMPRTLDYPENPSTKGILPGTSQSHSPSLEVSSQACGTSSFSISSHLPIGQNRQQTPARKRRKESNGDSERLENLEESNQLQIGDIENPDSQLKLLARSVVAGMEKLDFQRQMIAKRKLHELAVLVDDLLVEKFNEEQEQSSIQKKMSKK